jgi:uncharacterized glyoxalase superfamily protein PhnB
MSDENSTEDEKLDEALEETFPASDVPAISIDSTAAAPSSREESPRVLSSPPLHRSLERRLTMAKAAPVPPGFHTVTPHLVIRGATEAIEFYKKAFGAEVKGVMPGPGGKVMHGEIRIGDSTIMLNDEFPEMGAKAPTTLGGSPVNLHIYVPDCDALWNRAVAAGAKVTMPLADMFWGDRYGTLTDPFGHKWSIATHKEDLTPEEIGKRGAEAMKNMPGKS